MRFLSLVVFLSSLKHLVCHGGNCSSQSYENCNNHRGDLASEIRVVYVQVADPFLKITETSAQILCIGLVFMISPRRV